MSIPEEIGIRIRNIRTSKKMSLEVLAERSGISKTPLSRLERGLSNVRLQTLIQVAAALEVPLSAIIDASESVLTNGPASFRTSEVMKYFEKLDHQQQIDIIHFIKAVSEWNLHKNAL